MFVKAGRQDVPSIWVRSSSMAIDGHFKISEMYLFLKCSWSFVLDVGIIRTGIDGRVSQVRRPGKHNCSNSFGYVCSLKVLVSDLPCEGDP